MSTGIESHVESRNRMLLKLDLIVFNEMFFFSDDIWHNHTDDVNHNTS